MAPALSEPEGDTVGKPGVIREIFTTSLVTDLLMNPDHEFGLLMKKRFSHAVSYYAVLLAVNMVLALIFGTIILAIHSLVAPVTPNMVTMFVIPGVFPLAASLLLYYLTGLINGILTGLWLHLWVILFGGRGRVGETVRLALYGATPLLLIGWIPKVGTLLGVAYSLAVWYHGIRVFHGLSSGRAMGAVITFFIATAMVVFFLILAFLRFS